MVYSSGELTVPIYRKAKTAKNDADMYQTTFDERDVPNGITQYRTHLFGKDLVSPSDAAYKHIWSMGDRFHKLSQRYYGNYEDWWVIALFNGTPTEAHLKYGDIIGIPVDPNKIKNKV